MNILIIKELSIDGSIITIKVLQVKTISTTMSEQRLLKSFIFWHSHLKQSTQRDHRPARHLPVKASDKLSHGSFRHHLAVLNDAKATANGHLSRFGHRHGLAFCLHARAGTAK